VVSILALAPSEASAKSPRVYPEGPLSGAFWFKKSTRPFFYPWFKKSTRPFFYPFFYLK